MKKRPRDEMLKEFYNAPDDALFKSPIIAAVRSCSTAKLERDRWAGIGVPFIKDGRNVLYRKRDVLAYLSAWGRPIRTEGR